MGKPCIYNSRDFDLTSLQDSQNLDFLFFFMYPSAGVDYDWCAWFLFHLKSQKVFLDLISACSPDFCCPVRFSCGVFLTSYLPLFFLDLFDLSSSKRSTISSCHILFRPLKFGHFLPEKGKERTESLQFPSISSIGCPIS